MAGKTTQTKPTNLASGFFEQIADLGTSAVKSTLSEAGKVGGGMVNSLLGGNLLNQESGYNQGPMAPEYMPPQFGKKKEKPQSFQLFNLAERQEELRTNDAIRELVTEIRREVMLLEKQHKMVIAETARITVDNLPQKPGIYHVRFFEWLLHLLRDIRKKVGESATWLAASRGKRAKKGFWSMYKKHGTTFGLSGERTAATQSG